MAVTVKLDSFEGPLDLLLQLIEKNKVDICDIPIREITDQYLEVLAQMGEEKLDVMSDFCVMAAELLSIKARMLLPKPEEEEEEDPREELVQRLLEHKLYKALAQEMRSYEEEGEYYLYHQPEIPREVASYREPVDVQALFAGVDPGKLRDIFESVLKRMEERVDPVRSRFGTIRQAKVRLTDKIRRVQQIGREKRRFSFRQLLEEQPDKQSLVLTFLAILEMMKAGQIEAVQETPFGDIDCEWHEEAEGIDTAALGDY